VDKLGVKPGARVSVVGIDDPGFWAQLEGRQPDVSRGRARKDSGLVDVGQAFSERRLSAAAEARIHSARGDWMK